MTTRTLFPGPITLDTLPALFAHHRDRFGGFLMEETGGAAGSGDGAAAGGAAGEGASGAGTGGSGAGTGTGGGGQAADADKKFTQAELDKIIADRLGKEQVKFDAKIKELEETAGKTELEKLTAERDRYKEQAETGGKTHGQGLAKAEAKVAALVAKAREDRLDSVIAQADLSDAVGDDGTVDAVKVKTAIEKVLTDFPEWKAAPGSSGGELGKHGDGSSKPTFTRQQIKDMTPEERVAKLDELNAAAAEGRITG